MNDRTSKNYPLLTEPEMIKFLKISHGYTGNVYIRDVIELLILTALRMVELRTLKLCDLDF